MWKSLLDSLVESFAMCDPVAYMHYIEWKRQTARQGAVTPHGESCHTCVDEWVAFSDRMGIWQDNEDAGARRHHNEMPASIPFPTVELRHAMDTLLSRRG